MPHFSADSLFHGLPMCSIFRSEPKSHKHDKKFVPLSITFLLTVKPLTGMTTDVYPRENCIAPAIVLIVCGPRTQRIDARARAEVAMGTQEVY
jgi:hypothetical protein